MEERRLETRIEALERAVTEGEPIPELAEAAAATADAAAREERIDDLEARVAELEAATQALRGYVGNVRSVNEAVEERADAAVARVDDLERRLDALKSNGSDSAPLDRTAAERGAESPEVRTEAREGVDSVGAAGDPDWLAGADDRLPDAESEADPPAEDGGTDADGGLAARLGALL